MANVAKPKADNLSGLSQVVVPVSYSTLTGLALLLSDIIVSGKKVVPFTRAIPTASFISGNYSFPTPNGYVSAPYQLPMLEPQSWNVVADIISAYQPVELYQIGNKSYVNDQGISVPADYMTTTFPINIYPGTYSSDAGAIKPLEFNQSVIIRVYKNAGVAINWQSSNILNNGLTDAAIQAATELTFVVTNILGTYTITEWITPDFVLTNLSTVKTTAKGSLAAIINELYDRGTFNGAAAGGDLTGTYPSPTIGVGKVKNTNLAGGITADKFAAGVIPTTLPPSGNAGGDLTGTFPNPTIGLKKVTAGNMADGVIPTKLPNPNVLTFTGAASGSYDGSTAVTITIPSGGYDTVYDFDTPGQPLDLVANTTWIVREPDGVLEFISSLNPGEGAQVVVISPEVEVALGFVYFRSSNWDSVAMADFSGNSFARIITAYAIDSDLVVFNIAKYTAG